MSKNDNFIVNLNVGGQLFSTSSQTLNIVPNSYLSSLISGRIPSTKDNNGAYFIDRNPALFSVILEYLRTRQLRLTNVDIHSLTHEAEFFGLTSLANQLKFCLEPSFESQCGSLYFYCILTNNALEDSNGVELCQSITTIKTHQNWIAACFGGSVVSCFKLKESLGWRRVWTSESFSDPVERIALSVKTGSLLVAIGARDTIVLFRLTTSTSVGPDISSQKVGPMALGCDLTHLVFVGNQLVALGDRRFGVWSSSLGQQEWQTQDFQSTISSFQTAGPFLLLGCSNGQIFSVDMEKFPRRLNEGQFDLLMTVFHEDPSGDRITAVSCLSNLCQLGVQVPGAHWTELAYGTDTGLVRLVVDHPETAGIGPQLVQTLTAHRCAVRSVALSLSHLVSVCDGYHVRTWSLVRFRGMIRSQPGLVPLSSFGLLNPSFLLSVPNGDGNGQSDNGASKASWNAANVGPFGLQDETQVLLELPLVGSNQLFVRLAATGGRVCPLRAVDDSPVTCAVVNEPSPLSTKARPTRFVVTGHDSGSVQVWDLTTALENCHGNAAASAGGGSAPPQQHQSGFDFPVVKSPPLMPVVSATGGGGVAAAAAGPVAVGGSSVAAPGFSAHSPHDLMDVLNNIA